MSDKDKTIVTIKDKGSAAKASRPDVPVTGGRSAAPNAAPVANPYKSLDRTKVQFARPMPGGKPMGSAASAVNHNPLANGTPQVAASQAQPRPAFQSNPGMNGAGHLSASSAHDVPHINPVLAAAHELLQEAARLTTQFEERDPLVLRETFVQGLHDFEWRCAQREVDEESRLYARYILCTVLDELVIKTPWGNSGYWSKQSLLAQFHGETKGGEKFFQLLEHLQLHPAKYLFVLELMYVCMGLGFEGRYRLIERGYLEIERLRDNIFQMIRLQRGEPERQLSQHWRGFESNKKPLMRQLPVWVVAAVTGVLLLAMYTGFNLVLQANVEPLAYQLSNQKNPLSGERRINALTTSEGKASE